SIHPRHTPSFPTRRSSDLGEFIALDADTGTQLWQFQTGSGINAQPVTYTHGGHSERGDDAFHQSGISANVQTDPPCGTFLSASRLMFQYSPPMPESTVTYCRPPCV